MEENKGYLLHDVFSTFPWFWGIGSLLSPLSSLPTALKGGGEGLETEDNHLGCFPNCSQTL